MEQNNKQLITVEKESFFTKVKNLFRKKDVIMSAEEVHITEAPSPSQIDLMRDKFVEEQSKNTRMFEIQERYENGDYDLSLLTDDEMVDLMYLYHCQINDYRKKKAVLDGRLKKMNV